MELYQRNLRGKGERLLKSFPVLVVLGARQVGKSTFAQQLGEGWLYLDMENPSDAARVLEHPELFFADHRERVIFDEAQCQPQLFEYLRGVIDKDRGEKGQNSTSSGATPLFVPGDNKRN